MGSKPMASLAYSRYCKLGSACSIAAGQDAALLINSAQTQPHRQLPRPRLDRRHGPSLHPTVHQVLGDRSLWPHRPVRASASLAWPARHGHDADPWPRNGAPHRGPPHGRIDPRLAAQHRTHFPRHRHAHRLRHLPEC